MAGEGADAKPKAARRRRSAGRVSKTDQHRADVAQGFYGSALNAAERIELEEASKIKGLDKEIAVLRTKLRRVLKKRPEDFALMLRGIDLLVKAVSARYRLSKEAEENLADSLAGVVRGVGGLLMPEAFADE